MFRGVSAGVAGRDSVKTRGVRLPILGFRGGHVCFMVRTLIYRVHASVNMVCARVRWPCTALGWPLLVVHARDGGRVVEDTGFGSTRPTTMPDPNTKLTPDRLDEYLYLLAERERRLILARLREAGTGTVSLDALATALTGPSRNRDQARVRLQHTHLPKLDETDVIDYDARSTTIRYHGHPGLEALLEAVTAFECTSASS